MCWQNVAKATDGSRVVVVDGWSHESVHNINTWLLGQVQACVRRCRTGDADALVTPLNKAWIPWIANKILPNMCSHARACAAKYMGGASSDQ